MRVNAIVTAHNEADTIGPLLEAIVGERLAPGDVLEQVLVVSSGSTDRTDAVVGELARGDPRVRLLREPHRRGKCAAINWALCEKGAGDVVLLFSADVLPAPGALRALIAPFADPAVGMTGGRPVPTNDRRTLFGYAAHLLWGVHHRIALRHPKLGEVVAFRDAVESIPEDLAVDEAALEALLTARGLRLVYVPAATIHNRGAENLRDFLSQRRRISAGHLALRRRTGYCVSTGGFLAAARGLFEELSPRPRDLTCALITAILCLLGRLLGRYDFHIARRSHRVWDIAASTKGRLSAGSRE